MTELAIQLQDDPSFKIYRIDGARNEVLHVGVQVFAFPTIYFFPAGRYTTNLESQETVLLPLLYDGDRSVGDLLDFVQTHRRATTPPTDHMNDDADDQRSTGLAAECVEDVGTRGDESMMSSTKGENDYDDADSVSRTAMVELLLEKNNVDLV
jgi:hypothetical protein